jgi:hypothetical protein
MTGPATVYLGQFTWEHANAIAERLERAEIVWWCKNPGTLSYVFLMEWGPRLFVDRSRLDEAREIAGTIAPDGLARQGRRG